MTARNGSRLAGSVRRAPEGDEGVGARRDEARPGARGRARWSGGREAITVRWRRRRRAGGRGGGRRRRRPWTWRSSTSSWWRARDGGGVRPQASSNQASAAARDVKLIGAVEVLLPGRREVGAAQRVGAVDAWARTRARRPVWPL